MTGNPLILIIIASPSDAPQMEKGVGILRTMEIPHEIVYASAHRTPELVREQVCSAEQRGVKVIIACAGLAAHLAGSVAALTTLPVIGVPMETGPLHGLDALLSTVQMPPGIPVASMGIGSSGGVNAAIFAVQLLALGDPVLKAKLEDYRQEQARKLAANNP